MTIYVNFLRKNKQNINKNFIKNKLKELNNDFELGMNMTLKEEMEFELRFFKKCFDEILKNNSDYIVNVEFPYSYDDNYNNKEIKISYAEIDNIPDFCYKLAKYNLK